MWTIAFEKWYENNKMFINEKVKNMQHFLKNL